MRLKHLFVAVALAVVGCGDGDSDEVLKVTGVGTAEISIPLEISEITDVVATVSAPDLVPPVTAKLAIVGNIATGLVAGIPAGLDRTFSISAFVDAVLVCTGTEVVEIVADTRVTVGVTLDCSVPPPESGEAEVVAGFNFPPTISSVTATPASVVAGGTVELEVVAEDPDGDPLTYLWSATDGVFDVVDAPVVVWTAPAVVGDYSITIGVSDGTTTVQLTVVLSVL
jgi:hypothetical protein